MYFVKTVLAIPFLALLDFKLPYVSSLLGGHNNPTFPSSYL